MLIAFMIFVLLITAFETVFYFTVALFFWAAPLAAALAAAFAVAAMQPTAPLAPFYTFVAVALAGRLALSCLTAALQGTAAR